MSDGSQPLHEPASHYDRVAETWRLLLGDELHYGVFEQDDEELSVATGRLTQLMIDAARLEPDLDVLDVGCGNGTPGCRLAADHGVRVLGITTSQEGVAAANDRAAGLGLADRVRFELRDGTDNGLPSASFDRAWVLESSHLMRERARVFEECARVLRPGGRMVLCDIIRHREIPFDEVRARRHELATLRQAFGDAHMEPLEQCGERAEAAGLVVEELTDLTLATLPTFEHWRRNLDAHRAEVTAALGDDDVDAFARSADILEGYWREGLLGYGLLAARKPE
jgi:27-O-demethylrifamycin SV methyltransferase